MSRLLLGMVLSDCTCWFHSIVTLPPWVVSAGFGTRSYQCFCPIVPLSSSSSPPPPRQWGGHDPRWVALPQEKKRSNTNPKTETRVYEIKGISFGNVTRILDLHVFLVRMVHFILQQEGCRVERGTSSVSELRGVCVMHYTYCDSTWLCTILSGSQGLAACG